MSWPNISNRVSARETVDWLRFNCRAIALGPTLRFEKLVRDLYAKKSILSLSFRERSRLVLNNFILLIIMCSIGAIGGNANQVHWVSSVIRHTNQYEVKEFIEKLFSTCLCD